MRQVSDPFDVIREHVARERGPLPYGSNARGHLASSRFLSDGDARQLAGSTDRRVLYPLSRNPVIPTDVANRLAMHPLDRVAEAAVANRRTSLELAMQVAAARGMRHTLIDRPDCPAAVLADLFEQGTTTAAAHPNLPAHVRDMALACASCTVGRHVLANPYVTQTQFEERLAVAADPDTAATLVRIWTSNPAADSSWLGDDNTDLAPLRVEPRLVASNPSTPQDTLIRLGSSQTSDVRMHLPWVMSNHGITPETMRRLAEQFSSFHEDATARHNAALNPVTPLDVMDRLDAADVWDWPEFVLAHARTGDQAAAMLMVVRGGWTGSLDELLGATNAAAFRQETSPAA
jgi:hypothetical protein